MEYKIGEKTFRQKKLVLGQIKELLKIMGDFVIPADVNVVTIFNLLGSKASRFIATILFEDGKEAKDKNLDAMEKFIDDNVEYDVALEIIKDFFCVNAISGVPAIIEKIVEAMTANNTQEKA